jgi:hypothetical protein
MFVVPVGGQLHFPAIFPPPRIYLPGLQGRLVGTEAAQASECKGRQRRSPASWGAAKGPFIISIKGGLPGGAYSTIEQLSP